MNAKRRDMRRTRRDLPHARRQFTCPRAILATLSALLLLSVPNGAIAGTVNLQVINAISQQPLPNLRVDAFRRVGAELQHSVRLYTDGAGRADFDLDGVEAGVTYVFVAEPYNGGTVLSTDVAATGNFLLRVGKLPVTVVAGGTNEVLPTTQVTLREMLPNGTEKWVGGGTTTPDGRIILDAPTFGGGRQFVLEAESPWDGNLKRSNAIEEEGAMTFVVGNAPLFVSLIDALSDAPIAGAPIAVYERTGEGERFAATATTDDNGEFVLDIEGLGEGRIYFLRAAPFNGITTDSADLLSAGEFHFRVGEVSVVVERGDTGEHLPDTQVTAFRVLADGTHEYWRASYTDPSGLVRFDFPSLGQGARYVLAANSPVDGSLKYSQEITAPGEFVFPLGNAPLDVLLVNAWTGQPLAGVAVAAEERHGDGTSQWTASRTTDASGRIVFDLDGLGEGRTYFLSAAPYNGGIAHSNDVIAAGELIWEVGKLEVTVVAGTLRDPLPDQTVFVVELTSEGTVEVRGGGVTDEHGMIRFDPARIDDGAEHILVTVSPTDGMYKISASITQPERFEFVVGNAPLEVYLTDGVSGDPLPNALIYAFERLPDGELKYVASRETDAAGFAPFDLPGLGDGSTYVLQTAPYNGRFSFSEDLRQPGRFDFRIGTFQVLMLNGETGQPLPDHGVVAQRKNADGTSSYADAGFTDETGIIRFDLPGLEDGVPHKLWTASPIDGTYKQSPDITQLGVFVFRVGGQQGPPVPVVPNTGLLGLNMNPARDQAPLASIDSALPHGIRILHFGNEWRVWEPSEGTYTFEQELAPALDHFGSQVADFAVQVKIVDTNPRVMPADLEHLPFDDPAVLERLERLITAIGEVSGGRISRFLIGNEVDLYLRQHPDELEAFSVLVRRAVEQAHSVMPGVQVGVITSYQGSRVWPAIFDELNQHTDVVVYTYYPIDGAFRAQPIEDVSSDLDEMFLAAGTKPVAFTEIGYAAAPELGGSESLQAQFVDTTFASLHHNRDRLDFLFYSFHHDFPPTFCGGYGDQQELGGGVQDNWCIFANSVGLRKWEDDTPRAAWNRWVSHASSWYPD